MGEVDPSNSETGAEVRMSEPGNERSPRLSTSEAPGQRLRAFLHANIPQMYCDECLKREARLIRIDTVKRLVQSAASAGRYLRGIGTCSACKHAKTVTRAP